MKIILYGNGTSCNHGCEAIVRGTKELLGVPLIVSSESKKEDSKYGLDALCTLYDAKSNHLYKFEAIKAFVKLKLTKNYTALDGLSYLDLIKKMRGKVDFAFSVGGDNYCYSNQEFYAFLNKAYRKSGIPTILWGCSVDPEIIKNKKVKKDLKKYRLIVARESITYNAIKEIGANVMLFPDPAFFMKQEKFQIDQRFEKGNVVGINISPMIISNEKIKGITYKSYKNLICYILQHTEMNIALIPHVVWKQNDDREVLQKIYKDLNYNNRIIMVSDHEAPKLKYIISKCRFFIGARTHATIAAYSSYVPTIVIGYSVKARGIAKDLFGTIDNYVIPVQTINNDEKLIDAFNWLHQNEAMIRDKLKNKIPEYIKNGNEIKKILEKI